MKKQIIQLFHNMIGKDKKSEPDKQNIVDRAGEAETAGAKNVFDKVTDQKDFGRFVNDMLREGCEAGCILVGDVDRFKEINDIYGRDTGVAIQRSVIGVLYDHFEGCACIGIAGGDIFTLWIPGLSREKADYVLWRVGRVNDRLLHPQKELPPVSVSVGAAFYEAGDDCRSLSKRANKMFYRVKKNGSCGCAIYDGSEWAS
ncbi:MAG: GGDEF domain-containing protein [Lachnospiraceae bacterium]|nr:GGDEF domain-containing protein [Lachnospiraceae bacterium]